MSRLPPSARISTLAADLATTVAEHRRTDWRRLSQTVRGELDWIVMKCLDKDRNRRYESANALARDIERYLADEPVQACPPSAAYRLRKFARRNRTPVLAGSLVLLALVVGHYRNDMGHGARHPRQTAAVNEAQQKEAALEAAQQSARDAAGSTVLGAVEPGPRRPLQSAAGTAPGKSRRGSEGRHDSVRMSDYATRQLPRWPCPISVACQFGARRHRERRR